MEISQPDIPACCRARREEGKAAAWRRPSNRQRHVKAEVSTPASDILPTSLDKRPQCRPYRNGAAVRWGDDKLKPFSLLCSWQAGRDPSLRHRIAATCANPRGYTSCTQAGRGATRHGNRQGDIANAGRWLPPSAAGATTVTYAILKAPHRSAPIGLLAPVFLRWRMNLPRFPTTKPVFAGD